MTDLETYLRARRAEVDAALARALPSPPDCPAIVRESMEYSLLGGGKRLRPILALAAAETAASNEDARRLAMPAACAIEMIHTYSLIHDDLPAMDDDSLRRGRPTAHVVFGEGMAILAGDALLTEAFGLLAREPADDHDLSDPPLTARKLRTIAIIAAAAGATGMVGGQALDLQATPSRSPGAAAAAPHLPLHEAALRAMHAMKTGAMIRAAATAGATMAGADADRVEAIDRAAAEIGLAFQIVDDVLDVEGDAAQIGKSAGKDAAAGKPTYVALHGVAGSRELAAECIARAHETLAGARMTGRLDEIADWVLSRRT